MDFLQEVSKKFNTKIYVPIEDVEKVLPSLGNIKTWCIDNDKRKIVFDLEELSENPLNHYCDYLLFPWNKIACKQTKWDSNEYKVVNNLPYTYSITKSYRISLF